MEGHGSDREAPEPTWRRNPRSPGSAASPSSSRSCRPCPQRPWLPPASPLSLSLARFLLCFLLLCLLCFQPSRERAELTLVSTELLYRLRHVRLSGGPARRGRARSPCPRNDRTRRGARKQKKTCVKLIARTTCAN
jgi:hypothetical protein